MKYVGELTSVGAFHRISAPQAEPVRISVIMVVFHTGAALEHSLQAVLQDPRVDEFIVIDNGSTSLEAAAIARAAEDSRVCVVRGQGNVGFATAANLGAQMAQGSILIFLNPDAFLQPGCVTALDRAVSSANAVRLAGARILNIDGTEQRGARRGEVTPVTTLLSLTRLAHFVPSLRRFEIHREHDALPDELASVPTISGACFAMKRDDFLQLGGFDARYFLHVEDIDLCWRVRQAGGDVTFVPDARVVHLGSTSLAHPLAVEYHKGRGLVRYFYKRADTWKRKLLAVVLAPAIMAASIARPALRRRSAKARPVKVEDSAL
jgi:N-acetylglucosaminyl-diphospho-decaprenol L-rhamnosyltransferase